MMMKCLALQTQFLEQFLYNSLFYFSSDWEISARKPAAKSDHALPHDLCHSQSTHKSASNTFKKETYSQ